MHAEEQCGALVDRMLVVGGARPVRRADLDEPRAGARELVRVGQSMTELVEHATRADSVA
jgi:hypothetical protein